MNNDNQDNQLPTPVTPEVLNQAANLIRNIQLKEIDKLVSVVPDAAAQMGILMLAQALCFRRLMAQKGITAYFRKETLLRLATKDFQEKIKQFGFVPVSQDREPDSK